MAYACAEGKKNAQLHMCAYVLIFNCVLSNSCVAPSLALPEFTLLRARCEVETMINHEREEENEKDKANN